MKSQTSTPTVKAQLGRIISAVPSQDIFMLALMAAAVVNELITILTGNGMFILLYGLVGLASVAAVLLTLKRTEHHPELHDWCFLAMLGWSVISTVFAVDIHTSFFGTDTRNDGLYSYMIYAAIYVLARQVSNKERSDATSPKTRLKLVRGFTIMVTAMSLLTLTQVIWGVPAIPRIKALYAATLNNINHFAYLLCMAVTASAGLVYVENRLGLKILWLCLSGYNMWALIVNGTMGSYLAALFGILCLTVMMLVRDRNKWREAIAVAVVLLAVNLLSNMQDGTITSNFEISFQGIEMADDGIEISDSAGTSRIGLWRQAVKYIAERPVFGFGPEGLHERYYADGFSNDRPHNEYLQHAVFLGIPAALMYLAGLVSLLVCRLKKFRQLNLLTVTLGAVVATYCASALFGNTMYYTVVYYFLLLGLC